MKLKNYIQHLEALLEKYPDADVIYAEDDEGNGYREIGFEPSPGFFKEGEFTSEARFNEFFDEYEKRLEVNVVCVN